MRKVFAVLLGVLSVVFAAQTANAQEYATYYLGELGMEISLPADVYAITRDTIEGNPFLDVFGLSPDRALEVLEAENLYLSAVDEQVSFQLMLSVTEVPGVDFRESSDDELKSFLDIKRENYTNIGGTWISGSILKLEETVFLKIDFSWNDGEQDIRVQEHYTICHGKAVNLTLNSYTNTISEEMEDILTLAVKSIRFDAGASGQGQETDRYTMYRLEELGLDLEISVPMDGMVITQRMTEDDPVFSQLGISAEEQLAYMTENNVYMQIVLPDIDSDIYVSMVESQTLDFNDLSEETIASLADRMKEEASTMGMTDYVTDIYVREPVRYIVSSLELELDGIRSYRVQYYTIYRGTVFIVMLVSYSPDGMTEKEQILRQLVDSIRYDAPAGEPEYTSKQEQQDEGTPLLPEESFEVFYLEESDMEIAVPDSFVVFKRDISPDDPNLQALGFTWQYMMDVMENGSIYLDAMTPDKSMEFLVISINLPYKDLNDFSEAEIEEMIRGRREQIETDGMTWIASSTFQHQQTKFLVMDYSANSDTMVGYAREYYTLYDDKIITITLSSYYGELTAEHKSLLEQIINSVRFGTEPAGAAEDPAETEDTVEDTVEDPPEDTMGDATGDAVEDTADALWSRFSPLNLLFSFVMTVTIYSLPIFIYRWGIRRYPVEKKKAKIITIVYAVFSFVAMIAVTTFMNGKGSASAIWLWSWVNYRVLVGGEDKRRRAGAETGPEVEAYEERNEAEAEDAAEECDTQNEQSVVFCNMCGAKLQVSHKFCHKCGAENVLFVMENQK